MMPTFEFAAIYMFQIAAYDILFALILAMKHHLVESFGFLVIMIMICGTVIYEMQRRQIPTTPRESAPIRRLSSTEAPAYVRTNKADLSAYFMGTLRQVEDDSAFIRPPGTAVNQSSEGTPHPPPPAIREVGVFCDSALQSASALGYPNGLIPFQITDIMGIVLAPTNVIAITLSPFVFPRIYAMLDSVFEFFYHRRMYITIGALPSSSLIQARSPDKPFAFECRIENDGAYPMFVHVTPLDDKFILSTPINFENLFLQFQIPSPRGGFIDVPIPPMEITVARTPGNPTRFTIVDGTPITAIAPAGALWNIPLFIRVSPLSNYDPPGPGPPWPDPLSLLLTATGYNAVAYGANWCDVNVDTTFYPGPPAPPPPTPMPIERYVLVIPKNSIALSAKFWCVSSTPTNGLVPVHN